MNTIQTRVARPFPVHPACRRVIVPVLAFCLSAFPLKAATVNATYNSPGDVPIVTSSYVATGNTVVFSLNFTPGTGTSLTVIRNTGLGFIQGEFDNLSHGQTVLLEFGGLKYRFIANYFGRGGRDLVLHWANEKAVAWGDGLNGKLGNGASVDSPLPVKVSTADALWGKVVFSGTAGGGHSLGISSDGVASWGLNASGQLGINSIAPSEFPVVVTIPDVPSLHRVVAVSAGANHSLALRSDGKVLSWGGNTNGQLGNNSTVQSNVPVNVDISGVLASRSVVAISAGADHSLALCSDGTVVAWGLNANGQLGNNSTTQSVVPVEVTTASGALFGKTVIAVSAGAGHSLALCTDGTVAAWGLNANGQLGNNSTVQSLIPVAVTTGSGALFGKTVSMISAGGSHSLALCTDGTVASWGLNTNGQLGNGNNSQSLLPVGVVSSGVLNGKSVVMVSAGASHSLAACTDGSVAAWGANGNGELGNGGTLDTNQPLSVSISNGVITAAVSGSSASHSLALFASPQVELSSVWIEKMIIYNQSSTADPTLDHEAPYSFRINADAGTMGELLSSSTVDLPAGATGLSVYEKGSQGLYYQQGFGNKAALDAAYPVGSYVLHIRTSTPNTYDVPLTLNDVYPAIPKITGMTNATWVNDVLKITDPSLDTTITWNNPGNHSAGFNVNNTNINWITSTGLFTIPGGTLGNNSLTEAKIMLTLSTNGSPIPGLPNTSPNPTSGCGITVQFMIQVGAPLASEDPFYAVLKEHQQIQSSNQDPVDSPNFLPDSNFGPYVVEFESPVSGSLSDPSATIFPLAFRTHYDAVSYEYLSAPFASVATLNTTHPNGTYTFPGGVTVGMPADAYPLTPKILTVNGATPVWNSQGLLALDPTIDNTITWSDVIVPNFATNGHQSVEIESRSDSNFQGIEEERGLTTLDSVPITSLLIPKSTFTPTFTYLGFITYDAVPTFYNPSPGVNAAGVYQATNNFMMVAQKPQSITFGAIAAKELPAPDFTLGATASSGLPVSYEVVSGPATVTGNTVSLTGTGTVTLRASQVGSVVYASAASVTQSFEVTWASDLAEFRATYGMASDGSEDLLTPANDGITNLLKYAFNMIGSGSGQAASLSTANLQTLALNGNAGLPLQQLVTDKLSVTYIRRKASSGPGVSYAVVFSDDLSPASWGVNASAVESVSDIDADFERVTVTDHSSFTKRFARVIVTPN